MNIILTGATGFVGRNLVPALLQHPYKVTVIGRDTHKTHAIFGDTVKALSWNQLNQTSPDEYDAIIHLAGETIAQNRWTESSKKTIKDSRVNTTRQLVNWCLKARTKKPHLYQASAIGIYGLQNSGNELPPPLTESTTINVGKPSDFLSEVGQAWESAAKPIIDAHFPVTFMRFGVILKRHEGILKKLGLPFSLGLGSVLGNGQQAFSWVHIDDIVHAILFLLKHPDVTGAVNIVAPECISQKQFAKTLAKAMHRPLILTMPSPMIKILFGQMGVELLLGGQHVYPERLKKLGYEFLYPTLHDALTHEWKN